MYKAYNKMMNITTLMLQLANLTILLRLTMVIKLTILMIGTQSNV